MPLDPRIPLAGIGQTPPIDVLGPLSQGIQLRRLLQQQQLGEMQLQDLTTQRTEGAALRDIYKKYAGTPEFGGEAMTQELFGVSPEAGAQASQRTAATAKAQLDLRKALMDLRKANMDVQVTALKTTRETITHGIQGLTAVLGEPDDTKAQKLYEESKAAYVQRLQELPDSLTTPEAREQGIAQVESLPPILDRALLNNLRRTMQSQKEQVDEAWKHGEIQRKVALAQQIAAVEAPFKERQAALTGAQAGARQAEGQVRAAEIAGQTAYNVAVSKPMEGEARLRTNLMMQARDVTETIATEFSPEEITRYVGAMGTRKTLNEWQALLDDVTTGKITDPKFARFAALNATLASEAFSTGGKALTPMEASVVFGYIPTGKEWTGGAYLQKLNLSRQRLPAMIEREITIATTPQKELLGRYRRGELPAISSPAPGSPAAPGGIPQIPPGMQPGQTITLPDGTIIERKQ